MTAPPLPASPCVRVKLDYTNGDGSRAGSRIYLSYSGTAPTAANCVTLAGDVATAWGTDIAPLVAANWALTEIDVLDIATDTGASGLWSGDTPGSAAGDGIPSQCAANVEYTIARRYRGGKPRMFIPPPGSDAILDTAHFTADYVTALNTGVAAFFTALNALSVGAMGTLHHVNLSYYKGFTNIANSSGRERAVPTYRDAALLDTVTGYAAKAVIGSQRRRRISTTY